MAYNQPNDHDETRQTPPNADATEPLDPANATRDLPPVQPTPQGHHVRHPDQPARRQQKRLTRRSSDRRDSAFYLPLWSIALMLITVIGISVGIVLLVYFIGGGNPITAQPQVIIVTAPPSQTPLPIETEIQPTLQSTPADGFGSGVAIPTFALEGPTLPPVFLSPTPAVIAIGSTVEVIDVGEGGLNIRSGPGIENSLLFVAPEGKTFSVLEGPEQGGGLTWWQLIDPVTNQVGWAAATYLQATAGE